MTPPRTYTTPFDSPALAWQASSYPARFEGRIPYRVRITKIARSEWPFFGPPATRLEVRPGEEYECLVNSYGAVSAIIPQSPGCNTELGLKPDEFEVVEWHWMPGVRMD